MALDGTQVKRSRSTSLG